MRNWLQNIRSLFGQKQEGNIVDTLQNFAQIGLKSRRWWGSYQVEAGQSRFWRIGNIVVCVDRVTNEWHIASCPVDSIGDIPESNLEESNQFKLPVDKLSFKTFTFHTQAEIELKPILADLPLASKLERPIYIPGGEDIMLYVSSPVWVRVQTGADHSKVILAEIPTMVLSDTWFGTNTIEGELCYAGHTYCSPHLKDLPIGPDRIVSPMLIKNHAKDLLILENISVPLPYLSVYSDAENFLWTEQLYVYREEDSGPAVEVAKGPPKALEQIQLLTQAREEIHGAASIKRFFISNLS